MSEEDPYISMLAFTLKGLTALGMPQITAHCAWAELRTWLVSTLCFHNAASAHDYSGCPGRLSPLSLSHKPLSKVDL